MPSNSSNPASGMLNWERVAAITTSEARGTRKFDQHKSGEDRAATIKGQQAAGRDDIVAAIRDGQ